MLPAGLRHLVGWLFRRAGAPAAEAFRAADACVAYLRMRLFLLGMGAASRADRARQRWWAGMNAKVRAEEGAASQARTLARKRAREEKRFQRSMASSKARRLLRAKRSVVAQRLGIGVRVLQREFPEWKVAVPRRHASLVSGFTPPVSRFSRGEGGALRRRAGTPAERLLSPLEPDIAVDLSQRHFDAGLTLG